jgi:hypothetical protein
MTSDRSDDRAGERQPRKGAAIKRRDLLLSGTSLVAASALASTVLVRTAHTQQQPPVPLPAGRRPNILVIMGDDIGQTNISAYSFGVMATGHPTSTASPARA